MTGAGRQINTDNGLVDRSDELDLLGRAVADAGRGHGRAVVIEGPPGIGKTALLDFTRDRALSAGYRLLGVRGTELTSDVAYGAVRELFGSTHRHPLGSNEFDRAVHAVLDGMAEPADTLPGEYAALQALQQLTVEVAGNRPLVVIADDAHWIDAASLRYLVYLATTIHQQPILLVIATRQHVDPTRQAAVEQLLENPGTDVLRPLLLDRVAADQLLTSQLGQPPDPTFAAVCFRQTAGNPLMVRQLAAAVMAAGVTPTAANAGTVRQLGSGSVRAYVADRLQTSTPAELAVLQSVAVLGDGAAVDQIAALAGLTSTTPTAGALATLATRGLLTGTTFVHPLIRAAVYDSIDPPDRARMHRQAADLLIRTGADVEGVAAHYLREPTGLQAVQPALPDTEAEPSLGSAGTVLRRAAAEAQRRGAPESALRYLRRGLAVVASGPEHDDMVLAAGRAALQVDLPNSLTYLRQSLQSTRDPAIRLRLLGDLFGALLLTGRIDAALDLVRAEQDRLPSAMGADDPYADLRCYLASGIAMVAINNAGLPSSAELAELTAMPTSEGLGGRTLDGTLSMYQAFRADPEAIHRAERAVSDEVLLAVDNGRGPRMMALDVLLGGRSAAGPRSCSTPQYNGPPERARCWRSRAPTPTAAAACWFVASWTAAHRDATTARWATEICGLENRSFVAQVLADTCLADGPKWAEARAVTGMVRRARRAVRSALHLLRPGILGRRSSATAGNLERRPFGWHYWPASGSPQQTESTRPWSIGGTRRRCACTSLADHRSAKELAEQNLTIARRNGVRPDPSAGRCDCLPPPEPTSDHDRIELLDDAVTLAAPDDGPARAGRMPGGTRPAQVDDRIRRVQRPGGGPGTCDALRRPTNGRSGHRCTCVSRTRSWWSCRRSVGR